MGSAGRGRPSGHLPGAVAAPGRGSAMTDTQPRPDRTLVPFPAQAAAEMEAAEQHGHTAVVGLLSALFAGVVMLARSVKKSPKATQARAVVGYRLRKAPHDGARLG